MQSFSYFQNQKQKMIKKHLQDRGINDNHILKAFLQVPREKFLSSKTQIFAYKDRPVPIGYGQTISQPYVVALSCQLLNLKGTEKVLDIGTGSGYQAAILSLLCRKVITIEIIPQLAHRAQTTLRKLGYSNIKVIIKNGRKGYPPQAPYDAVNCAASSDNIPTAWKQQLVEGGRIVMPHISKKSQKLIQLTKKNNQFVQTSWGEVRYVPLMKTYYL